MTTRDLTVKILESIRDEVRQTNVRLDTLREETNARLDQTNTRLDQTNTRLEELARRVVESEVRTSTAIADLAGTVREMTGVLRASADLRPRVERCEQDIAELQRRVG